MNSIPLQRHSRIPPFTRDLSNANEIKWSAAFEVPAIGDEIVIRVNNIRRAVVVGYATQDGYLGVMSVPLNPPSWWVAQNGQAAPGNAALAFGAEISPIRCVRAGTAPDVLRLES